MRAANPDELREYALPIMTAQVSEVELGRWFPSPFEEITDPWAAAEPSKGALLRLGSGDTFAVYWGHDSGEMTVRIAPSVDAHAFLKSFFREVPLPRARVTWLRDGVALPVALRAIDGEAVRQAPLPRLRGAVLLVEDDGATVDALRRILEAEGLDVEIARDGEKAMGCLAQRNYDVIVLDIALPKMSGTDVMEYVASVSPDMLQRIVVVTGLEVAEIRKLFPVGEALSKPVMPERLISVVRRMFGYDGAAAESQVS